MVGGFSLVSLKYLSRGWFQLPVALHKYASIQRYTPVSNSEIVPKLHGGSKFFVATMHAREGA